MWKFAQSIKFKIGLALGTCVSLTAIVGLFGVYGLSQMNSAFEDAYSQSTLAIANLSEVRASQLDSRLQLRRNLYFRDLQKTKIADENIRADWQRIEKAWSDYYPNGITSEKERSIADEINNLLPQIKASTDSAVAAMSVGNYDAAAPLVEDQARFAEPMQNLIREDTVLNMADAKRSADDSGSMFRKLLWITVSLVGVSIALALSVSIYLVRSITLPLGAAVPLADKVADGELGSQIAVESRGEFGQLLEALKRMDSKLSATVRGIKASAESVAVASQEIASGNGDLSARTEEHASSLEETAASMKQLTDAVKQNADSARQANALATDAANMADIGNKSVLSMVDTIDEISSSSRKISGITGVIEGIAFQTNILALNAAVEAARAGEQGRGFAVVASEVRSLAQRSATAAKEIKELISSSVSTIQDGAKQVGEVGATVGRVKQAIDLVSDIVGEIAAASEEQSRGIAQVNQAVGQTDELTQQNAALVEEAAASTQSLREQANSLKGAVSVINLSDIGRSISRAEITQSTLSMHASRTAASLSEESWQPKTSPVIVRKKSVATNTPETVNVDWESF